MSWLLGLGASALARTTPVFRAARQDPEPGARHLLGLSMWVRFTVISLASGPARPVNSGPASKDWFCVER